ncbi:Fe-S cluster assembly ATPase SufC [Lacrimispora sp.]|uniref:Fe-S cluster assembly ATPase SufC n=1 Tax=Lacrimispora sp. TaxID=2719234 RepID=UPI0032E4E18D
MSHSLLEIKDLIVSVEDKIILNGINLTIGTGELHVLMGPNGTGKSTLVSAIMGDPRFQIESGQILLDGKDITEMKADERAKAGVFLSFQVPEEIPGVTLEDFLRTAKGSLEKRPPKILQFKKELKEQMKALDMDPSYAERYLNVGFSGGEKKKTEILQLLMLQPKLALLDETDSGLDVDAVRTVTKGIRAFKNRKNGLFIITHNARILEGLDVDVVHVLEGGKIAYTGGQELISKITQDGFGVLGKGGGLHEGL